MRGRGIRYSALIVLFAVIAHGCTSVRSVYLSNLSAPREAGREISADVSKFVILGFDFSSEIVFEARERLYRQCPDGVVTGVMTVLESRNALLLTVETVRVRGYCVPPR